MKLIVLGMTAGVSLLCLSTGALAQTAEPASPPTCPAGWFANEDGDCDPPKGMVLGFNLAGAAALSTPVPTAAPVAVKAVERPAVRSGKRHLRGEVLAYFALGSKTPASRTTGGVSDFVQTLASQPLEGKHIVIMGHTDASGSRGLNLRLSAARAQSIKTLLVAQGVDASQIEVRGYGYDYLARPKRPYGAVNRRVEAVVVTQ